MSKLLSAVALLGSLLVPLAAHADPLYEFSISLTSPIQTVSPGGTVTFSGLIQTNFSDSGTLFLNLATLPTSSFFTDSTVDASSYLAGYAPGATYNGPLFSVSIPTTTGIGSYGGNFSIFGGGSTTDNNHFAFSSFKVNVVSPTITPTPEPSSLALLTTGVLGLAGAARRRLTRN